jgi:NADPH:quinone reductase-like Zn-dependent oxidoreductase
MKGILLSKAGGDYALVDTIEKPKPGKNQILVKSLVAGLNPV